MTRLVKLIFAMLCAVIVINGSSVTAQAADAIGEVEQLRADVYGVLSGETKRNRKFVRYDVVVNETIVTDGGAAVFIRFKDNTTLTLGERASLLIDDFVYAPEATTNTAVYKLTVGALRFISGEMGGGGIQIETPTTNIGIRGSDALIFVTPDGATTVNVYSGVFTVTPRDSNEPPIEVKAKENVTVSSDRTISPVAPGVSIPDTSSAPDASPVNGSSSSSQIKPPDFVKDFGAIGTEHEDDYDHANDPWDGIDPESHHGGDDHDDGGDSH